MKRTTVVLAVALSVISGCAKTFYTADGKTMYTVTENPADPIGYVSTFLVKMHALIGIPYGRHGQPRFFTTLAACENARTNMKFTPTSLAALWETPEVPPSTPCEAVHYEMENLPQTRK